MGVFLLSNYVVMHTQVELETISDFTVIDKREVFKAYIMRHESTGNTFRWLFDDQQ